MRWAAVLIWAAVIFRFSSLPGSSVPGRFGNLAHFVEYGILGGLLFGALQLERSVRGAAVGAVLLASLYAVTDEFHQSFVPMRVPDPRDWVLDTAGAIAGVLLVLWLNRWRESRPRR